jgi:mannan endo-1,4-beta-mannosidase
MNGVNFQPAYYCDGQQSFGWPLLHKNKKIGTVRIELETHAQANVEDFGRWLREARDNNLTVLATYHRCDLLGSNNATELLNAAKWWQSNYHTLVKLAGGPFFINLMNEWGDHSISADSYAAAYNSALAVVRRFYHDPVIVDIPGWGQEFYTAAQASPLILDQNIVFSAHVYGTAWDSQSGAPTTINLDVLQATRRPCVIGEFGDGSSTTSTDWRSLVSYAYRSLQWPVLGWAWNGDGGSMNMLSPPWTESIACQSNIIYEKSSYFDTIYELL